MNFSPYKPSPDDNRSSRRDSGQTKGKGNTPSQSYASYQAGAPSSSSYAANSPSLAEEGRFTNASSSNPSGYAPLGTLRVNKYETSLPVRVDIEAALSYLLGPVSGILLLILERQNDYVRFHAWQSTLTFVALMCAHFILMFISTFLSWFLFCIDIVLMIWLTYRAYLDGVSLERYELPYFGPIASEWVDTE